MARRHTPTWGNFPLLVFAAVFTGGILAAGKSVDLNTVCEKATETINGYSMKEVCRAMASPLNLADLDNTTYSALSSIFPSVSGIAALTSMSRHVGGSLFAAERGLQQLGGLAEYYVVSYLPGIGCTLASYNGLIQNVVSAIGEYYIMAISKNTVSPKKDMFRCKFSTGDILPVPVGARQGLAASNLLFPGSFAALKPLVRCEFNLVTPVDVTLPVAAGDPSQGYYSSFTRYLNQQGWNNIVSVHPGKRSEAMTVTCKADRSFTALPYAGGGDAAAGGRRHLLEYTGCGEGETGPCPPPPSPPPPLAPPPGPGVIVSPDSTQVKVVNKPVLIFQICVCYPGKATVQTPDGAKAMDEVQLGEKVLALSPDGKPFYDTVYLIPHQEATRSGQYLNLHIELIDGSNRTAKLTLSEFHHVLVACDSTISGKCEKYAKDAAPGDVVFLMGDADEELAKGVVVQITSSTEQGIFNPLTMSGNFIVDGVLASMHSKWVGEETVMHYLPKRYHPANLNEMAAFKQWILTPFRGAYHLMVRLSNWLASNNLPSFVPFKYVNKLLTVVGRKQLDMQFKNEAATTVPKAHVLTSSAGPEGAVWVQMERFDVVVGSS